MSENNLEAMSEDHDDGADLEWVPPSEAEQKVLNARRERSDKISKRMGDYLLKGYKIKVHQDSRINEIQREMYAINFFQSFFRGQTRPKVLCGM